jgi:flavin-dependent dehydrogenase
MKTHYDVIIIGAGPAGFSCAEQLKSSELSVLLIDKNKTVISKTCAGGLSFLVKNSDIPLN